MKTFGSSLATTAAAALLSLSISACGSDNSSAADGAGGAGGGGTGGSMVIPKATSAIEHVVIIVQENHSFDNHFGHYCSAPTGSNPTCTDGPACCEAGPSTDPGSGATPVNLDDMANGAHDPDHSYQCEIDEMNGGAMDHFVMGASCSHPGNFAYADTAIIKPYWDLAAAHALADRYFQPIAGASIANDLYLARAGFVFYDNQFEPTGAVGSVCSGEKTMSYGDSTLGDLLNARGVPWAVYAEGYKLMADAEAAKMCPAPPADCPAASSAYPCTFDPGDIPFLYYTSLLAKASWMRDLSAFSGDIGKGKLPSVSFIKPIGYKTEHPGAGTRLSDGIAATTQIINQVLASSYADKTLVLLTYDEGGGYFDHVPPPPANAVDGKPYGVRVPMLAIGPFARKNHVSHVTMEHSSIVRFIEWNWLDGITGQLGQRDASASNLGSLLDPAKTGTAVPE